MSTSCDLNKNMLKPITITTSKLIKYIDKLYFGFIRWEKKKVTQATIIENNNSNK